jgi:hypothetical protein
LFEQQLAKYAGHAFRACHQLRQVQLVKKTLRDGDLLLHIDYSENYLCKWANEIQAAHFGNAHHQIVIHQGVMYVKVSLELQVDFLNSEIYSFRDKICIIWQNQEPISFATLSDDTRKTSEAIAAHIESILIEAEKIFNVNRVSLVYLYNILMSRKLIFLKIHFIFLAHHSFRFPGFPISK